jgi:hypothetical protein
MKDLDFLPTMIVFGIPPLMLALLSMDFLSLIFPIHIALFVAAVSVIDILGIIAQYLVLKIFKIYAYSVDNDSGQKTS